MEREAEVHKNVRDCCISLVENVLQVASTDGGFEAGKVLCASLNSDFDAGKLCPYVQAVEDFERTSVEKKEEKLGEK